MSWRKNGPAVSCGAPVVAAQVEKSVSLLPLFSEYPQSHLHPECYRIGTPPVQEADGNQRSLSRPNKNSHLKLLYLGLMNAQDKYQIPALELEFDIVTVSHLF